MKLEERVRNTIQHIGIRVFMDAITKYDTHEDGYGAWLLTFGLLDTFKIIKGISDNDITF